MDPAIAHSIYTGIGYAGAAIAGLVGVSYVGLDITNLAIVAGALSVGIGFGLQSIVNNFVSGLILLIERPMKVGDWIVVKGQEGYVRRISVRATEIETFDRASLILPNSELITGPVTNWTHRNAMGRVIIRVGATYKADPQHVMDVLTEVGRGNAFILQQPAPRVVLDNLGVDGFEFSIRVFVADINKSIDAQNSLRVEIHKAFLEAGIAINTVHQDLLLREAEARRISPGPQPMDARRR
jgi:potassium-dependent mechanosensitive channel